MGQSFLCMQTNLLLHYHLHLFSCFSSFPPSWLWFGPKQLRPKTLATAGTQPHPNLKDPRFSFSKEETEYFVQISKVWTITEIEMFFL